MLVVVYVESHELNQLISSEYQNDAVISKSCTLYIEMEMNHQDIKNLII